MLPSADRWLLIGALSGLLLALVESLGLLAVWSGADEPAGIAVQVNDGQILQVEVDRALEALARDKRNPLRDIDRQRVLDTLISEELLVQRAQAIGLVDTDRAVRKALVDSMMQYLLAQAAIGEPDEETLQAYYRDQTALAQPAARIRLRHAQIPSDQADYVTARLTAEERFSTVFAGHESLVPDKLVPLPALDNYLPAGLIQELAQLQAGDVAGPFISHGRAHFVWIQELERPERPAFAAVRDLVRHQWLREQNELATRRYVQTLRDAADIRVMSAAQNS